MKLNYFIRSSESIFVGVGKFNYPSKLYNNLRENMFLD